MEGGWIPKLAAQDDLGPFEGEHSVSFGEDGERLFYIEDMVEVVVCKVDFENGPEKGAIVLSQLWGLSSNYTS